MCMLGEKLVYLKTYLRYALSGCILWHIHFLVLQYIFLIYCLKKTASPLDRLFFREKRKSTSGDVQLDRTTGFPRRKSPVEIPGKSPHWPSARRCVFCFCFFCLREWNWNLPEILQSEMGLVWFLYFEQIFQGARHGWYPTFPGRCFVTGISK